MPFVTHGFPQMSQLHILIHCYSLAKGLPDEATTLPFVAEGLTIPHPWVPPDVSAPHSQSLPNLAKETEPATQPPVLVTPYFMCNPSTIPIVCSNNSNVLLG